MRELESEILPLDRAHKTETFWLVDGHLVSGFLDWLIKQTHRS